MVPEDAEGDSPGRRRSAQAHVELDVPVSLDVNRRIIPDFLMVEVLVLGMIVVRVEIPAVRKAAVRVDAQRLAAAREPKLAPVLELVRPLLFNGHAIALGLLRHGSFPRHELDLVSLSANLADHLLDGNRIGEIREDALVRMPVCEVDAS